MRKDREQAVVLRKSGMSYSDIVKRMSVPKSTLSDWFKGEKWSNDIAVECAKRAQNNAAMRFMVLNVVRGNRLRKIYEDSKQDAFVDFEELKYHPLFISGVMAYWAHGDKTSRHIVSFTSSDPKITMIFVLFMKKICGVDTFKARISIDRAIDEQECVAYWMENTGLKYEQFTKKPIFVYKYRINSGKIKRNFGICNIVLSSAYLKSKFLKWIELMAGEIGEEKYSSSADGMSLNTHNAGIV